LVVNFDPSPLRQARQARELTLTTVGAQIDRDASQVSRYERCYVWPTADVLAKWLNLLDVKASEVFPDAPVS